jgi:hypothetical protein
MYQAYWDAMLRVLAKRKIGINVQSRQTAGTRNNDVSGFMARQSITNDDFFQLSKLAFKKK